MSMTKADFKKKILEALEALPGTRWRSVLDFIEYLRDREAWLETQEILADKKIMAQLRQADRDWKGGKFKKGDYMLPLTVSRWPLNDEH